MAETKPADETKPENAKGRKMATATTIETRWQSNDSYNRKSSASKFQPGCDFKTGIVGFTHDQIEAAFNLVKNPRHWKDEINATIDCLTDDGFVDTFKLAAIAAAVEFFTATPARILVDDAKATITADGYRRGPAGDH